MNINSLPGRLFIKVTLLGHGISFRYSFSAKSRLVKLCLLYKIYNVAGFLYIRNALKVNKYKCSSLYNLYHVQSYNVKNVFLDLH